MLGHAESGQTQGLAIRCTSEFGPNILVVWLVRIFLSCGFRSFKIVSGGFFLACISCAGGLVVPIHARLYVIIAPQFGVIFGGCIF